MLGASVERDGLVRTQTPQGARRELLLDAFDAAAGGADVQRRGGAAREQTASRSRPSRARRTTSRSPSRATSRSSRRARAAGSRQPTTRIGFGAGQPRLRPGRRPVARRRATSKARRGCTATPTATSCCTPLATAILAACGLGDLGRSSRRATRRRSASPAPSCRGSRAPGADAGWRVARAQVSVVGARPRLGAQRSTRCASRSSAELLALIEPARRSSSRPPATSVGDEGAGRVISATRTGRRSIGDDARLR